MRFSGFVLGGLHRWGDQTGNQSVSGSKAKRPSAPRTRSSIQKSSDPVSASEWLTATARSSGENEAYTKSWRMGLKAVAIYRDNSKRVQPLSSGTSKGAKAANGAPTPQIVEKIV